MEFISLFFLLSGLIIGLGAVTVIDIHGFLARKSEYWTEATTRTHKITKPLIWLGMSLTSIFGSYYYYQDQNFDYFNKHLFLCVILVLNGIFLSFNVSPFLLEREKRGLSSKILPKSWQTKISISFVFSIFGWWGLVLLLTHYLLVS